MGRPKNKVFDLKARVAKLLAAGFTVREDALETKQKSEDNFELQSLPERIQLILGIINSQPVKATTMNYLIMYDIEKDKVRSLIAKYLLSMVFRVF